MGEYVEVFAASDITFAYLIKANLETTGIPAQITNEHLQAALCVDGMVPCVLVPATHVEQGKRIMGYQQLWILEAKLKDLAEDASVDTRSEVA